jgi:ribosomal protein S18 acetylase RimI-like enzyme
VIREYRPDTDHAAVRDLYVASFPGYTLAALDKRLKECTTWVWVTNRPHWGKVIGYVILDHEDGAPYLEQIAVHRDHQRKGLGMKLMRHAERHAERYASLDGPVIRLHVLAGNPAQRLYARRGYVVMEFIRNLYGYGFDGYELQKTF